MLIERVCGECEACCTTLGLVEIGKPPWTDCPHQWKESPGQTGCSIYKDRPKTCQDFKCLWLTDSRGKLQEKDRPDVCGVLLVPPQPCDFTEQTKIPTIVAWEIRPGAFASYHGHRILKKLGAKYLLVLLDHGRSIGQTPRFMGPPNLLRIAHLWLTQKEQAWYKG